MRICNVVQGHQCGSVVTKFWKAGPRSFTRLHWIHLLFLSHVQTWKTFCCITIAAFFLLLYINWFMWAKSIYKIPCTGNVESSSWQFHLIDHHLYIVRVFFREPKSAICSHGWQQPKYQKSLLPMEKNEAKPTVVLANPLLFVGFEINCDTNLADRNSTRTRNSCKPSAHVTRSNQILKLS